MDNIKKLFLEAWSLGEQNADNPHGGFGFWWDRNKSIIEHELKQLHKPVVGGPVSDVRSEGEQLGNEGSGTVAARGQCEHECTGPWDCQCQDVIDAFYRGVERKSSEGQL